MSLAKEYINPLLEKSFEEIRSYVSEIERRPGDREQIAKAICDYVGATVAGKSKSLASSLYTKLSEKTLNNEPFLTNKNKNRFYDKDIWSMIFDKYSFTAQENINYARVDENLAALPIPVATVGLGALLSLALPGAVVIPVALLVATGLYVRLRNSAKASNTNKFVSAIDAYLDSIKSELLKWFEAIEQFYHQQVNEVKASL